jgi:hypothetical protein
MRERGGLTGSGGSGKRREKSGASKSGRELFVLETDSGT